MPERQIIAYDKVQIRTVINAVIGSERYVVGCVMRVVVKRPLIFGNFGIARHDHIPRSHCPTRIIDHDPRIHIGGRQRSGLLGRFEFLHIYPAVQLFGIGGIQLNPRLERAFTQGFIGFILVFRTGGREQPDYGAYGASENYFSHIRLFNHLIHYYIPHQRRIGRNQSQRFIAITQPGHQKQLH